jgi:anti-sigma-K factor RskA
MTTHEEFEAIAALDAIGAASDSELEALAAHAESCAECRRAVDEYAEAATAFGRNLSPVTPPTEVRKAIMDSIPEDAPGENTIITQALETEFKRFDSTRWWLAAAATIFFALWGWREMTMRAARERLATQTAELQTLTAENALIKQRNEKLTSEVIALASSGTRMMSLTGQQVAPSATARVFMEPEKHRAVVLFANLPSNPNDKSYQLWVLGADPAKPQSAATFDVGTNGTAAITVENLPADAEIKGMAVTMEPKGGVEQPTNAAYYVMGKI